jgi:hypothetical protein
MTLPILACYLNMIFVFLKLRIYQMLRGYMGGYNKFSYPQGKHVYDLYETLIHFCSNCISFFSWMFFTNTFLFWGIVAKSWCTSSHPSVSLHNSKIVASPSNQWNLKTKTPEIHTFFIQCLGTNPQYPDFELFHTKTHKVICVHRIHVAQRGVKRENVTWTWRVSTLCEQDLV